MPSNLSRRDLVQSLQRTLGDTLMRAPGAQYLLWQNGDVIAELHGGLARIDPYEAVGVQTSFNWYSISKAVTAALARNHEAMKPGWRELPIAEATGLPNLQGYGSIADCLAHRAGFPNPMPLRWVHAPGSAVPFDSTQFAYDCLRELKPKRLPDKRFRYSNLGYLAVGLAIAQSGGRPFEVCAQELLDQLPGRTELECLQYHMPASQHAFGHVSRRGLLHWLLPWLISSQWFSTRHPDWIAVTPHAVNGPAYGGVFGNARGLLCFARSVLVTLNEGPTAGNRDQIATGIFQGKCQGRNWIGHAGGGLGFYGEFRIYPDAQTISILLTNGTGLRDVHALDAFDQHW